MKSQMKTHLQYADILNDWNPLQLSEGGYDTEIADIIQAVHQIDDTEKLARKIQSVYEFSFEKVIPLESCRKIAGDLLVIKNNESCSL